MNARVRSVTGEPFQTSSERRVSSFKDLTFSPVKFIYKSEMLLIASTLFAVKAKNVYWNKWKQSSAIKQFLETLLRAIKMCHIKISFFSLD